MSEFKPTSKQIKFMLDTQGEYVNEVGVVGASAEGAFRFTIDRMFVHEDKDIRVGFSRSLMYQGFQKMMDILAEAMLKSVAGIPKADFDDMPKELQEMILEQGIEVLS